MPLSWTEVFEWRVYCVRLAVECKAIEQLNWNYCLMIRRRQLNLSAVEYILLARVQTQFVHTFILFCTGCNIHIVYLVRDFLWISVGCVDCVCLACIWWSAALRIYLTFIASVLAEENIRWIGLLNCYSYQWMAIVKLERPPNGSSKLNVLRYANFYIEEI